jgi:hypothetical protein
MPGEGPTSNSIKTQLAGRVSVALQDVQLELRATARAMDFFAGYNLGASIEDRLDEIGKAPDDLMTTSIDLSIGKGHTDRHGRLTAIARLIALREQGLAAIEAARNIREIIKAETSDEDLQETTDPGVYRVDN